MKTNTQELAQFIRPLAGAIDSHCGVISQTILEVATRLEELQAEHDSLSLRVEWFRAAAQPIVDDYFDWLESKQIDVEDMSDSYKRIYDMIVNLKTALSEESK